MPVDDKWIGLALAVSSSAAIGMSYIITKKVGNLSLDSSGPQEVFTGLEYCWKVR
jgi:hypothetical protein